MRKNLILIGGISAALVAFACSSDDNGGKSKADGGGDGASTGGSGTGGSGQTGGKTGSGGGGGATGGTTNADAGDGATPDGSNADAGDGAVAQSYCGGKTGADLVACGKDIVEHIDACADCHSPRNQFGQIPSGMELTGNATFADIVPGDDAMGLIPTPNLTQLAHDGWTAPDVKNAILNGKNKGGQGLFPIMPYITFHNMADIDAEAIAQYIVSLTYVTNDIPPRQPLPAGITLPVPVVPVASIPDPVSVPAAQQAAAMRGKYLAAQLGVCMECHTEHNAGGFFDATSKFFAGGEKFVVGGPFGVVTSLNITPDPTTGIAGWTADDIKTELKTGVAKGVPLCPPMPVGPNGAFGGLSDADALAIGEYITHLPAVTNGPDAGGRFLMCVPPGPPPGDGGTPDGAAPTDAATGG